MSKLIVIEGPDKVGKETQSKLLLSQLRMTGHRATLVEVPVHDVLTYKVIYWMLQNGLAMTRPNMFQWFQYANKRLFQEYTLPDLEKTNDYVILDRWDLSAIVYGAASGASSERTEELCARLRKPDLTLVLHGKSHIDRRDDVYEKNNDLQLRVRALYHDWATKHEDCELISCEGSRMEVHGRIVKALSSHGLVSA